MSATCAVDDQATGRRIMPWCFHDCGSSLKLRFVIQAGIYHQRSLNEIGFKYV